MISVFLCCLFLGCAGEVEEKQPISMEDFVGEYGEETVEEVVDVFVKEAEDEFDELVFNQLSEFDSVLFDEFHPIDRFTFSNRKKIGLESKERIPDINKQGVAPRTDLYYYTFADTTKTKNALYNWLDCFGSDCDLVNLNEDIEDIKMAPLFSVVYDTVMVIADFRCEDNAFNWKPFKDSIIQHFGNDYNYRIEVGCNGPLRWK